METKLRAGMAIYNAGGYHAAHDAWEEHWLDLESGTDDEFLLHGLIQFSAAIYHARNRNWAGATGLATSAGEYLDPLSPQYRQVNLEAVRSYLHRLGTDPELIERGRPLALRHGGERVRLDDLDFEETAVAARVLAEEHSGESEEELIEDAIRFARQELSKTNSAIVPLLFDYVREPESRGIIRTRLGEHVDRKRHRRDDVSGLFDQRE